MKNKMEMANRHGVNAFLFDWYWYDDHPYLERPLETAFIPNAAAHDMKFAVMWANHHWTNIHPWKSGTVPTQLESGSLDADQFRAATDYMLKHYFSHPAYLRIDGLPYLTIYDLRTLIEGLGSLDNTRAALDDLRDRAVRAGHPGIHLNAVAMERSVLPQDDPTLDDATVLTRLGFDSRTWPTGSTSHTSRT